MYKSPIELTVVENAVQQIVNDRNEQILRCVLNAGVNVDKAELIRALAYDRNQYEKGYRDAMSGLVRCKECKFSDTVEDPICGATHRLCRHGVYPAAVPATHFCGYGERAGGDT